MATDPTEAEMEARTVRFGNLTDNKTHHRSATGLPGEVFDVFAPNTIFPMLVPKGYTGRSSGAPLKGEPGLYMSITECPPGARPALHIHPQNIENFFCVKGRFRIRWGEAGDRSVVLSQFDLCSVPAGIYRTFENIGDEAGLLLVIVNIRTEEQSDDVIISPVETHRLSKEFGHEVIGQLEQLGYRFAGADRIAR
jgi:uncharacterized RmlC-like cupin family protein